MHPNIQEQLDQVEVVYKEIKHQTFDQPINSPFDFAKVLGYEPERISKSVFLRAKSKDKYIMAICSCTNRLDLQKLAALSKVSKLEMADHWELSKMVGYPRNGVCAIGIPTEIEVYMDINLLQYPTILIGGGEIAVELELAPQDLTLLAKANLEQITMP